MDPMGGVVMTNDGNSILREVNKTANVKITLNSQVIILI